MVHAEANKILVFRRDETIWAFTYYKLISITRVRTKTKVKGCAVIQICCRICNVLFSCSAQTHL